MFQIDNPSGGLTDLGHRLEQDDSASESHSVRLFATPWTIQSIEFSRLEYWSGQPFPSPGDLPNPGIKPRSPALQADSLPAEPLGKPQSKMKHNSGKERQADISDKTKIRKDELEIISQTFFISSIFKAPAT